MAKKFCARQRVSRGKKSPKVGTIWDVFPPPPITCQGSTFTGVLLVLFLIRKFAEIHCTTEKEVWFRQYFTSLLVKGFISGFKINHAINFTALFCTWWILLLKGFTLASKILIALPSQKRNTLYRSTLLRGDGDPIFTSSNNIPF